MSGVDPPPPPGTVLRPGYPHLAFSPDRAEPEHPSTVWRVHLGGETVERRFEGAPLADPRLRPVLQLLFGPLSEAQSLGTGTPVQAAGGAAGEEVFLEIVWEDDRAPVARSLLLHDRRLLLETGGALRLLRRLGRHEFSRVQNELRNAGWLRVAEK